jgi:hypothetical protein
MGYGIAIDSGEILDKFEPLSDGRAGLPAVLEHTPKIDIARMKIRLEANAFLESIYRARPISNGRQGDAKIEIGGMQETVARIMGDPGLVQIGGELFLTKGIKLCRATNEICDRKLMAYRPTYRIVE